MSSNSEDFTTKPTVETILERINLLGDNLQGQIGSLRNDLGSLRDDFGSLRDDFGSLRDDFGLLRDGFGGLRNEFQLFRGEVEIRLDRIEGMTNQTRAEMLTLRADFKEFQTQVKDSIS
jgi:hypothetical protein